MLKGRTVDLRTVRSKDLDAFLELSNNVETLGMHFPLRLRTETSVKARFDKDGFWGEDNGTLLVVDKETDRILGSVVFFQPVHYYDAVEIGYIIYDPKDRGKGIASEAVRIFIKYLFRLKPIFRIQLQAEPGNVGSRRVAEKCGFKFEGTARGALISGGLPADIDVYSILRGEFEA